MLGFPLAWLSLGDSWTLWHRWSHDVDHSRCCIPALLPLSLRYYTREDSSLGWVRHGPALEVPCQGLPPHIPGPSGITGPAYVQRAKWLCDVAGTQGEAFKF